MSDIRLIDANAMYKRFCVDRKDFDWVYDSTDLPDMLGGMPTIDAIPVEWLEYMQMESMSENDRTMVGAIEAILIEWHIYVNRLREMDRQKEQEEQDGKNRKMGEDER